MFKPIPPVPPVPSIPPVGPPNSFSVLNVNTPLGNLSGHIMKTGIITFIKLTNSQGKKFNLKSIDIGITKQIDVS